MKNKKVAVLVTSFMFLFILAPMVYSAYAPPTGTGPTSLTAMENIVKKIVGWVSNIVLLIGVMMIAWAGFTWMTAGGDTDKLGEARQRLIWGLVGIAVALFAGMADDFIMTLLGS